MRSKWPKQGETRVRSGFLWLPMTIDRETRWLERATWEERVSYYGPRGQCNVTSFQWNPDKWIDDDSDEGKL
jgi:hypothetical protein